VIPVFEITMLKDEIVETNFVWNETQENNNNHEMQNDAIVILKKWFGMAKKVN
jgi:hypothetical protein